MNSTTKKNLQKEKPESKMPPEPESEMLSGDIKTLAEAISSHFRVSTKLWTLSATIMLVVIASKPNNGAVSVLGFNLDATLLYPVCGFLLAIFNIAFCSAHLQAYRITHIYHELLFEKKAKDISFTKKYSVADAAHALYLPTLNRIYPLIHYLPFGNPEIVYKLLKIPVDIVFYSLPILVCYYSLWLFFSNVSFVWSFPDILLVVIITFIILVSTCATLMLINVARKWIQAAPNIAENLNLQDT